MESQIINVTNKKQLLAALECSRNTKDTYHGLSIPTEINLHHKNGTTKYRIHHITEDRHIRKIIANVRKLKKEFFE